VKLLTPPGVFARIVPFLVGGAAVLLLVRRPTVALPDLGGACRPTRWVDAGVLVVSVYGGYFGAAAGVLMLALLLTATPETLVRATALKTLLLGLANLMAALGFVVFGPVAWRFALPLTGGLLLGSWVARPPAGRAVPGRHRAGRDRPGGQARSRRLLRGRCTGVDRCRRATARCGSWCSPREA